jgi:hypothetical protein
MPKTSFAAFVWAVAGAALAASVGCKPASVSSHPPPEMDSGMPVEDSGTDPDVPPDAPLMFDSPIFNFEVAVDVSVERTAVSPDAACAANSQTAKQVPLDMYIMFDQSTSMSSRWGPCVDAVKSFLARPSSAGLGVGIQYFAIAATSAISCATNADCGTGGICSRSSTCSCSPAPTPSCDPAVYAHADVDIAPLPGNYAAMAASLDRHCPATGTPTGPALQGAIMKAKDWTNANPGHKTIVALVTDGDPNDCSSTIQSVEQIASDGLVTTPRIPTFVIGIGSSTTNLNGIAMAGGTEKALMVEDGPTAQEALASALDRIRGSVLPCEFLIPTPPKDQVLDFNRVNVSFTATGQSTPRVIPRVSDLSQCTGDGWAYDNPAAPTLIRLCPMTCDSLRGATGTFDIILGCDTVIG